MLASEGLFHTLIRTHHITSKKKIANLKKAASTHSCYVLLHSGKCPGIMYCEGNEMGVKQWIANVQSLRYKDYRLAARPIPFDVAARKAPSVEYGKVIELSSVKAFSDHMAARGILEWWRHAMGYI